MMRVTFVLCILGASVAAQGTFTRIPSGPFPTAVSADGSVVVGSDPVGVAAWRWTASEGVQAIGVVPPDLAFSKVSMSKDGKTIVWVAPDANGAYGPAVWEGGRQWRPLGTFAGGVVGSGGKTGVPWGVSADGSVIVGHAYVLNKEGKERVQAFRWDRQNGTVQLPSFAGEIAQALTVSGDGTVILGTDTPPPGTSAYPEIGVMWWNGTERALHPFGWSGSISSTNHSGTVVVGKGGPFALNYPIRLVDTHAYRWTAGDGLFLDLGALTDKTDPGDSPLDNVSSASAASEDGNIVVGSSTPPGTTPAEAMIWTPQTGMRRFTEFLGSKGITGWENYFLVVQVTDMTPDGKVFIGTAVTQAGAFEGWIVKLE